MRIAIFFTPKSHTSSACPSFLNHVRQRYLLLLLNGESVHFLFLNRDVSVLFLWVFKKTLHGKLEQQPRVWSREGWAITDLPKFESLQGRTQCSSSHGLHKTTKSKRMCLRVYTDVNSSITREEAAQVSLSSLSMIWPMTTILKAAAVCVTTATWRANKSPREQTAPSLLADTENNARLTRL